MGVFMHMSLDGVYYGIMLSHLCTSVNWLLEIKLHISVCLSSVSMSDVVKSTLPCDNFYFWSYRVMGLDPLNIVCCEHVTHISFIFSLPLSFFLHQNSEKGDLRVYTFWRFFTFYVPELWDFIPVCHSHKA